MENATNSPRFSPLAQSSSLKISGNRYLLCPLDKRLLEIFELSTESPSVETCYSSVVNACIGSDTLKIKKMTAVVHDKNRSTLEKKSIYFSFLFEAEEQIKLIKCIFATIVTGKDSELNRDFFFNCPTSKWQSIEKVSEVIVDFCKINCASIFNCLFYDTEENFEKVLSNGLRSILPLSIFNTMLHLAVRLRKIEHVGQLLTCIDMDQQESFAKIDDNRDFQFIKKSPLHVAIEAGHEEIVEYLINSRASTQTLCKNASMKLSAAELAVALGRIDCLGIITKLVPTSWVESAKGGNTLLHVAVHFKQFDMLEHLLVNYSSETKVLLDAGDSKKRTPLILAAYFGQIEAFKLLWAMGADIEAKDAKSCTALHYAANRGHEEIVRFLIDNGADLTLNTALEPTKDIKNWITNAVRKEKTILPVFAYREPENLVLQGGGLKGTFFIGAIEALEERDKLKKIRRIAGSREGALVGIFLALGCKADVIKLLLQELKIKLFLEEITAEKPSEILDLLISKVNVKQSKAGKFREWIESKIYEITKKHFCTFGELKELIGSGKPFKHFYTFLIQEKTNTRITVNSEEYNWKDAVISDTLCAAMSIPNISNPHPLYYRDDDYRYEKSPPRLYYGSAENEIDCFDFARYVRTRSLTEQEKATRINNPLTLGLHLCSRASEKGLRLSPLTEAFHCPSISYSTEMHRIIKINNEAREGLLAFTLTEEDEKLQIDLSKKTVLSFFKTETDCARSSFKAINLKPLIFDAKLQLSNINFSGRTTELGKIESSFFPIGAWNARNPTKQFIIYGSSGMGKSTLACTFANNCIKKISLVHWIDHDVSIEKLTNAYRELAKRLKIPILENASIEEICQTVFHRLENHSSDKPWLLVLDNVNETLPLIKYPKRGGLILYVTRSAKLVPKTMRILEHYIQVKSFNEQEALLFLKKCFRNYFVDLVPLSDLETSDFKESITKMVSQLGKWPILLERAVSCMADSPEQYIKDKKIDIDTYLSKIKNYCKSLLEGAPLKAFELRLKELKSISVSWLHLFSHFSGNIPKERIIFWLQSLGEEKKEQEILSELEVLEFISFQNNTISFTPLTREILHHIQIEQKILNQEFENAVYLFSSIIEKNDFQIWLAEISAMTHSSKFDNLPEKSKTKVLCNIKIHCFIFLENPGNPSNLSNSSLEYFIKLLNKIMVFDATQLCKGHLFRLQGDLLRKQKKKNENYANAVEAYRKEKAYKHSAYCFKELGDMENELGDTEKEHQTATQYYFNALEEYLLHTVEKDLFVEEIMPKIKIFQEKKSSEPDPEEDGFNCNCKQQ